MPKTSKKKSKTKRKVNKACASKCKSTSVKFTGKDKKQFLKMCIASCSVDTKQFLLPKEQVLLFIKMELSKGANGKKLVKKMFKDLPDNPAVLEVRMDDVYQTIKEHYIPLLYELKNDKNLLK
jgi:hypothetical protein